jgi:hypothetical protein
MDPFYRTLTRRCVALALAGVVIGASVLKRIPAGAGLGGGSADAAAVLRWAGFRDLERAASIGADVAFCLVGGRARVRGVGELVEPLPFVAQTFTVVTPAIHSSTPVVYAKWDDMGGPTGDNGNDLESAALAVEPELARARTTLGDATGEIPRLAGSGSSWFVAGTFPESGRVLRTLPADTDTREVWWNFSAGSEPVTVAAIVHSRYGISNQEAPQAHAQEETQENAEAHASTASTRPLDLNGLKI